MHRSCPMELANVLVALTQRSCSIVGVVTCSGLCQEEDRFGTTHKHRHMHTHTRTCTHAHMHTHTLTDTHTHIYTHTHTLHAHTQACRHKHTQFTAFYSFSSLVSWPTGMHLIYYYYHHNCLPSFLNLAVSCRTGPFAVQGGSECSQIENLYLSSSFDDKVSECPNNDPFICCTCTVAMVTEVHNVHAYVHKLRGNYNVFPT